MQEKTGESGFWDLNRLLPVKNFSFQVINTTGTVGITCRYFWKMTTIDQVSTHFLPRKLQGMIYSRQKSPALKMLNRMIDFGGGFFQGTQGKWNTGGNYGW